MDKQICFVLLSCMFATVYLQDNRLYLVINFVTTALHLRKEPLSLSEVLVYQPFAMMGQSNYLIQVRARNANYEQFICTGIVTTQRHSNALAMDDTHCSSDQPSSPPRKLINTNDFQKIITKAVDSINKKSPHMMIAASLKEVKLIVMGCFRKVTLHEFELTVAKTSFFNMWTEQYGNATCPILKDQRPLRLKFSVRGATGTLIDDPVVELSFLEEVKSTK